MSSSHELSLGALAWSGPDVEVSAEGFVMRVLSVRRVSRLATSKTSRPLDEFGNTYNMTTYRRIKRGTSGRLRSYVEGAATVADVRGSYMRRTVLNSKQIMPERDVSALARDWRVATSAVLGKNKTT